MSYPNLYGHLRAGYELVVREDELNPGKFHAKVLHPDHGASYHFVGLSLADALRGLDDYLDRHGDERIPRNGL